MTIQTQVQRSFQIGGYLHQENRNIDGTLAINSEVSLAAAKVGQLTTRTDNDTGVLTMVTGHGIVTSNKVDVYWSGGSRRNMTATVSGDAVTVDGGAGDNLPANLTAVTAMVPTLKDVEIIGDNLLSLIGSASAKATISIQESDGTERYAIKILTANTVQPWLAADGGTNPLATYSTEKVAFSHGDSTGTKAVRLSGMY